MPGMQGLGAHPAFDANAVRRDFPILNERVNGRPLIWLDNAATTQKPQVVIDRLTYFYQHENSNIHRAAHELAARATDAYEGARETVRRFLNAPSADEIVFLRGTTEAINLVAHSWGRQNVREGDEIVITWLEHHANIVPWQQLCNEAGAKLRVAPVDDDGQILLDEYQKLLGSRTKVVSLLPGFERARYRNPGPADDRDGTPGRRAGAGGWGAVRLAHACGHAAARLRLVCFLRPQGIRSNRDRRAVR